MSENAGANLSESIGNFAELVAAGTPTPGGGSVSAYCGVLASSLGLMVCRITIGKPKYAAVEQRLTEITSKLDTLSARLHELISEDSASFEQVLRAYRLPKDTDEQKADRTAAIQHALQGAVNVPFETAQRSFDVLTLLGEISGIATPNALSDVAVGAQLAQVAVRGAAYNVSVNLDSLSDRAGAEKRRGELQGLLNAAGMIASEVEAKLQS